MTRLSWFHTLCFWVFVLFGFVVGGVWLLLLLLTKMFGWLAWILEWILSFFESNAFPEYDPNNQTKPVSGALSPSPYEPRMNAYVR